MIAALGSGVSGSGLDMIATSSGGSEQDVPKLLRALKPLLRPQPEPPAVRRVSIVGGGRTAQRIADILALVGFSVSVSGSAVEEDTDLGVVVGHYVLDPESYGFWLRRDLPHLPIVFGDDSVMFGPLVEPGSTPCLYCLEHYRRDADASWSAIASQLWGRRASSETALVAAEVAARVARIVASRLEPGRHPARSPAARSFRLDVDSGEVTRRDWMPHPDYGCVQLSVGRPESGSAPDSDQPRTVAVSVSPV